MQRRQLHILRKTSFDITPPHLISDVVTDKVMYVPYLLNDYFKSEVKEFY